MNRSIQYVVFFFALTVAWTNRFLIPIKAYKLCLCCCFFHHFFFVFVNQRGIHYIFLLIERKKNRNIRESHIQIYENVSTGERAGGAQRSIDACISARALKWSEKKLLLLLLYKQNWRREKIQEEMCGDTYNMHRESNTLRDILILNMVGW